jgi:uncharacterized membrane protein YfcA
MLALSFLGIALLYALIGFGGGSSYLALLSISDFNFLEIPKIALLCNLIVVSGGSYLYFKKGYLNLKLILPFIVGSIPFAFIGGLYPLTEKYFYIFLSMSLLLSGIRLLFFVKPYENEPRVPPFFLSFILGSVLGLLSGLVGLGGGIFLSPLLHQFKWGRPKEIAASASFFIFVNSISGLLGQMTKQFNSELLSHWPLFLAVLVGGQIGSRLSVHQKVSSSLIQRATAILILSIAFKLLMKIF